MNNEQTNNTYKPISNIEDVNSLLDDMDTNSLFIQIDQQIKNLNITPDDEFYDHESSEESYGDGNCCFFRMTDSIMFIIMILNIVLLFLSSFALILEIAISFYSVIMINYVFFVSSMVSYTMAPIYQSLSGDWLYFVFSLAQVIIASPLIAFYIFYILKSVINLASFLSNIPEVGKRLFHMIKSAYYKYYSTFFTFVCESDYQMIFGYYEIIELSCRFVLIVPLFIIASSFAYILFCLDKVIILLGSLCYILHTIQIIIIISPSYLYFFQTLFNVKCKEIKFIKRIIKFYNKIKKSTPFERYSDDNDSNMHTIKIQTANSNMSSNRPYLSSTSNLENHLINEQLKDNFTRNTINIKNDKYIEEDEWENEFIVIQNMLIDLLIANNYLCLYNYSKTIAFDRHKQTRKIVFLYIFFALNLSIIAFDIYQLIQDYSGYLLASIIIRFLFVPLFSFYHILTVIWYKANDKILKIVLTISAIVTIIIIVVIAFCFAFTDLYQSKYRIRNLEYKEIDSNLPIINKNMIYHPVCINKIFDITLIDAFGYALGGYDIKRNETIFDNQMKIFFGPRYKNHISYLIHEFNKHFFFIKYFDSSINTHIFAFRGYNSGPEVAFQFELFATYYIIPFFEGIVPFYELINDYWLNFYTEFANSFGLRFFENKNVMVKYVDFVKKIYNDLSLDSNERVVFSGINSGGVIAKILGSSLNRNSISFISFPIYNELLQTIFGFSSSSISLVTNVYNVDGFFSHQEPDYATNIGVYVPPFGKSKFCTSDICYINSKKDNVYRTFCTMAEICGKGIQFNYYCENAIGKEDLKTIQDSLKN